MVDFFCYELLLLRAEGGEYSLAVILLLQFVMAFAVIPTPLIK
jgi:hypothetical protein